MAAVSSLSAPEAPAEQEVLRLGPAGRVARVAVAGVVLLLLLTGTVWGDDDAFPFGPFRMYSTRADPNQPVVSTRVVGLTEAGEEVRLSGGEVGLRRAEFEGQVPRIQDDPELLGLLADAYAEHHPSAPELVEVQVIQRWFELDGGAPTGNYTDRVLIEFDLEDQS
jgi:hypothetical protein